MEGFLESAMPYRITFLRPACPASRQAGRRHYAPSVEVTNRIYLDPHATTSLRPEVLETKGVLVAVLEK